MVRVWSENLARLLWIKGLFFLGCLGGAIRDCTHCSTLPCESPQSAKKKQKKHWYMVLLRLTVTVCPIGGCRTFLFSFFFFNSVSYKFFVLPLFTFFYYSSLIFHMSQPFHKQFVLHSLRKKNLVTIWSFALILAALQSEASFLTGLRFGSDPPPHPDPTLPLRCKCFHWHPAGESRLILLHIEPSSLPPETTCTFSSFLCAVTSPGHGPTTLVFSIFYF